MRYSWFLAVGLATGTAGAQSLSLEAALRAADAHSPRLAAQRHLVSATEAQLRTADGKRLNDWLRTEAPGSKPRLTAELFAGFATLLPVESSIAKR